MPATNRKIIRQRLHRRVRRKVTGTAERPRLAVFFSNKNVYAQIIDDAAGRTLASSATLVKGSTAHKANQATAAQIGKTIAQKAKAANISSVVFDRGGHKYHGKVKALADAAREAGLQF
jgi:large subunit ribosomal protein L18